MFAEAYNLASSFTKPVIISSVREDGTCRSAVGSFVVVNDEGWILTAAHILDEYQKLTAAKKQLRDHKTQLASIASDTGLLSDQKKKQLKKLGQPAKDAVADFSFWRAWNGVQVSQVIGVSGSDLALGKLTQFDPKWVTNYPSFKDPAKPIRSGTSLCRLGFPFHYIVPTYASGGFQLPAGTFPMVFFPNEGILTRVLVVDKTLPIFVGFIETSSPGLMGQSGGPIFDQQGTVWGIQSHTSHLPLGFSPPVPGGAAHEKEHQFMNVGRGAHPATIIGLMKEAGVKHTLSAY